MAETVKHTFPPIFNAESKILILGTMPSPKSREDGFYYGHPRNRFWPVLSSVLNCATPQTTKEKTELLLTNRIALWDVLKQCTIENAADSTIENPVPNNLSVIFSVANIQAVFTNGKTAFHLYKRFQPAHQQLCAVPLPSTSPANARFQMEQLTNAYAQILPYITSSV